ncbi:MAG: SDH family Clp fold serine proteinase [Thiobacillaceae bacterium]
MGKQSRRSGRTGQRLPATPIVQYGQNAHAVDSLLDCMQDGREFGSIVDKVLKLGTNLMDEVINGIQAIEALRGRPCLLYTGNLITKDGSESGIDATDEVPFQELVGSVPLGQRAVDIYLASNGGSGEQVSRFVNCLRTRFDEVNFLIPSSCMSAGTLFALSGERIYMTPNAFLGPIDPQVPSAGGRYVPAQALLLLVQQLQRDGDEAMRNGLSVPWTAVRLIDSLDKKELGAAMTASQWSQTLAEQYIVKYKFKHWTVRQSSGRTVTDSERVDRAKEIATALVSHERWKNHGHAISRDVLWNEIRLKIDHPDVNLERAMVRLWALLTYIFDKAPTVKLICGLNYRYARNRVQEVVRIPS